MYKNNLWQEAIQTELKQLTEYETFIVLDSGEDIPKGYQKIPYHIVCDVKYDLRHKARLVAGGNWTVNDKEDIYSGVVISLLAKKIIRSENSIFWTGTSPKSTGFKTYLSSSTKIMLDFKKKNKNSSIKISDNIGLEAWTFLRSTSLFMLSSIYNAPFANYMHNYKRLLMFLYAPRIYNEISGSLKRSDINSKIYKKKIFIFKNMLMKNNLIGLFLLIKLIARMLKIIKLLSRIFSYLNDFLHKTEFTIVLRKKNETKIKNLIVANKLLL
jgi:hypothetical protein